MSCRHIGRVEVQMYSCSNRGTRRDWVAPAIPWLLYPQKGALVPIVQEAQWASGLVWIVVENLSLIGV